MENKKESLMSAEEFYDAIIDMSNIPREHWQNEIIDLMDNYAAYRTQWHLNNAKEFVTENDIISHHINVLAEKIADNYSVSYMTDDGIQTSKLKKQKVLKIAKDYINELNLNK